MENVKTNRNSNFDPIFTFGIVGRCRIETLQQIKESSQSLKDFETIYVKTTKGKRLWIKEEENNEY